MLSSSEQKSDHNSPPILRRNNHYDAVNHSQKKDLPKSKVCVKPIYGCQLFSDSPPHGGRKRRYYGVRGQVGKGNTTHLYKYGTKEQQPSRLFLTNEGLRGVLDNITKIPWNLGNRKVPIGCLYGKICPSCGCKTIYFFLEHPCRMNGYTSGSSW